MMTVADYNFRNQRALVRVDFNVPLDKQTLAIKDDSRIKAAVPSINKILRDGGSVILMSHLGRPKNGPEDKYSLRHIIKRTSELLNHEVKFTRDCVGKEVEQMSKTLKPGEILLLEN